MTSMPASRSARAMIFAPRSWPSRPRLAITTLIFRAITASLRLDALKRELPGRALIQHPCLERPVLFVAGRRHPDREMRDPLVDERSHGDALLAGLRSERSGCHVVRLLWTLAREQPEPQRPQRDRPLLRAQERGARIAERPRRHVTLLQGVRLVRPAYAVQRVRPTEPDAARDPTH